MNQPYLSKQKLIAALLLLTAFVIYSCRKDVNNNEEQATDDDKLIADARAYFEATITKGTSQKNNAVNNESNPFAVLSKNADWERAYTNMISIGKMVMLPVKYDAHLFVDAGDKKVSLKDFTRLFIYTDKKGKKHIEVVTQLPDEAYSNNKNVNKKFSGNVLISDWQGNFIKGFYFKADGTYARLSTPVYSFNNSSGSTYIKQSYQTNQILCYPRTISGSNTDLGNGSVYEWSYTVNVCVDIGSPPRMSDEEEPIWSDYGGCGDCTTPPEPEPDLKDPCIEKNRISARSNTAIFHSQKTALQAKLAAHADKEWGIEQNLDAFPNGNYKNDSIRPGVAIDEMDFHFYWDGTHGYTTGFIHDHPSGSIPNPTDAFALLKPFENAAFLNADQATKDLLLQNITSTVVLYDLTYVMTIKDLSTLRNFQMQYNSNPTAFIEAFQLKIRNTGDYDGSLLISLGSSINLYKADANSNEYTSVILNSQNKSEVKPCPTN